MSFSKDTKEYTFSAIPVTGKHGETEYKILFEGKPVQVLGKAYDDRTLPYVGACRLLSVAELHPGATAGDDAGQDVFEAQLDALNSAIGRAPSNPAIRRGNVTSEATAETFVPCLVFAPESTGIDGVAYAEDADMLSTLAGMVKRAGFDLPNLPAATTDARAARPAASGGNAPARNGGARQAALLQKLLDSDKNRKN